MNVVSNASSKANVRWTCIALMLGLLMAALDSSAVSTALPTVVSQLGGLDRYAWVFSAYMIASVASIPIFGKLSDMYGRKKLFLLGLVVFMAGSALCGAATSMPALIASRALQGIGGGSMLPIVFTIVFDIFPPEQRAKTQGFFGAVFGLSSVLGPLVGGFMTDYATWRWIFYINLPLGVVSFILLSKCYREKAALTRRSVDWAGAVTLVGGIVSLMFALELGGKRFAWHSTPIAALLAAAATLLILFFVAERKAADPIVPFGLFRSRSFSASLTVSFLFGIFLYAGTSYVPMFVQGVLGETARGASRLMIPMEIALIASSIIVGGLAAKMSPRIAMTGSAVLVGLSLALLGGLQPSSPLWSIVLFTVLFGLGIGISLSVLTMAALVSAGPAHKGAANSLITFSRLIGGSLGLTLLGTLQLRDLKNELTDRLGSETAAHFAGSNALVGASGGAQLPAQTAEQIAGALAHSVDVVFRDSLVFVAVALVVALFLSKQKTAGTAVQGEAETAV